MGKNLAGIFNYLKRNRRNSFSLLKKEENGYCDFEKKKPFAFIYRKTR
jgi:hypothetical protein